MSTYSERCRAMLNGRFNGEDVSGENDPNFFLFRAFLAVITASEADLATPFEQSLAAYAHDPDGMRVFPLLACAVLLERDTGELRAQAAKVLQPTLDRLRGPENIAQLLESGAALHRLNGDDVQAAKYREQRLGMPLFRYLEEIGLEATYLTGPEASQENPVSLARSTARAGLELAGGSALQTLTPLVLAFAWHAKRAGAAVPALLRDRVRELDAGTFDATGAERFSFEVDPGDVEEAPLTLRINMRVHGSGTLVSGVHDFATLTWHLPATVLFVRNELRSKNLGGDEVLHVDADIYTDDAIDFEEDVETGVRGRAHVALEIANRTSDVNVNPDAEVDFVTGE